MASQAVTSDQPRSLGVRLFRPIVLAAGMCLLAGGCGTVQNPASGPLESLRAVPSKLGLNSEGRVSRKEVEADPFPEAGPDGL